MLRLILVIALSLVGPRINAATEISQEIETKFKGKVYKSLHTWTIDDKSRFTLKVDSQNSKSLYIFNGRTFFVCAKLKKEQIEFLKKNNIDGSIDLAKFSFGACQAVPSNFMVRFFLSPSDAIESIDFSDGLKVSLTLDQFDVTPSPPQTSKVREMLCENITKTYELNKIDGANKTPDRSISRSSMCVTKNIAWSQKFWREVAKVILRQTGGGGKLIAKLRKNLNYLQGFALTSESSQDLTANEKTLKISRKLTTTSTKTVKINNNSFALPSGYGVFNPESIALKSSPVSRKTPSKNSEQESVSTATSVFFCAISGGFGCFNF